MVSVVTANDRTVRLLAASAVASSHTGDTNETALATITIPAGAMGLNGWLRVEATFSYTNSANAKTLRVRLGGISGTSHFARSPTTTAGLRLLWVIANRGAANSQVGWQSGSNSFDTTSGAITTSAIDTSAATTLVITGLLANSGETIRLESYAVELLNGL